MDRVTPLSIVLSFAITMYATPTATARAPAADESTDFEPPDRSPSFVIRPLHRGNLENGGATASTCGNNVRELGEDCDGSDNFKCGSDCCVPAGQTGPCGEPECTCVSRPCDFGCSCGETIGYESPPDSPPASPCGCEGGFSGDQPVLLHSGEFQLSAEDLRITGRGVDFVWARKYRSRLGPITTMGNGWDSSYNIYLEQTGQDLTLSDGNTRRDVYSLQPDGTWTANEFFRVLEQNLDDSYTLTFSDTGVWHFDPLDGRPEEGKVSRIVDRNGNTLTFDYDAQGRLITIHDTLDTAAHNRDITISYNSDGFIESVTDFIGRQVRYEYYDGVEPGGGLGDLKSATSPAVTGTPTGNNFPNGKTTTYTYSSGFGNEAFNHNLLTITDPKGQTFLSLVYGPSFGVLPCDRVARATWGDPGDNIDITYVHLAPAEENNLAIIKAIVNDRVGNVKEYFFDSGNRLVLQREYTGRGDPDQPTTETTNRPISKLRSTDPDFFETQYQWNGDSLPNRVVHPNLNEELLTYDESNLSRRSQGNLLEHCRLPGPLGGDQAQICESFEYDKDLGGCCGTNFVTKHTDARGNATEHLYDANGNRTHTTHRIPSIVEDWEYNQFGQMTAHILPDNGAPGGHRRRDENTYYTEVDGAQFGYLKNRIIGTGFFNLTTTYEYDSVGNVTRMIDPGGDDTLYTYNQLDQVVRVLSPEVVAGSGVRYWRNTFYDANDNIVREDVQNADGPGTPMCTVDPSNPYYTKIFEHEILNRPIRKCEESGTYSGSIPGSANLPTCIGLPESEFVTTEYEYDANRSRTLIRYGEAVDGRQLDNIVGSAWDERKFLLFRVYGAAAVSATVGARLPGDQSTTQYDYDHNGNRMSRIEGLEQNPRRHTYSFDGFDRQTGHHDPMGNVRFRHFDANGNRRSEMLIGERIDQPGDGQGEKVVLQFTMNEYDEMNRPITSSEQHFDCENQLIGDGQAAMHYFYTSNSQIARIVDDNDHETLHTYDTANRKSLITDPQLNTITYSYDADSNVTSVTHFERTDLPFPATDETFVTTHDYDGLDRLIRTIDNISNTHTFGHDSRNNRNEEIDALDNLICRSFDGLNRPVSTTKFLTDDGTGGGTVVATIVMQKTWDDSSRLIARADDNGNTTRHTYDALGRLIVTQMADGTLHQVGTGALWPLGGSPDLSSFTSGYDVHHNAIQVTDANGTVVTSAFDLNNRVAGKSIMRGPGVSNATSFELNRYDGRNRKIFAQDDDSIVERCWDSMHNILEETLTVGAAPARTVVATYDGMHNQLTCAYPGGRVISTTYDELDRKKTITDQQGLLANYDYVGPDRVTRRDFGNSARCAYTYDGISGISNPANDFGVKRIIGTTHSKISDGTIIDDRTYTWDGMFNEKQRTDIRAGGPGLTHDYSYDSIYELTRTIVTDLVPTVLRDTQYELDGVGNRLNVTGGPNPGTYTLDPAVPPVDLPMNQYTTTPFDCRTYDGNGNLTALFDPADCPLLAASGDQGYALLQPCITGPGRTAGSLCHKFDSDRDGDVDLADFGRLQVGRNDPGPTPAIAIAYDYRNQMVEYTESTTGLRHTYAYDVYGRRIRRVVDADGAAEETRYYCDDRQIVEEQDASGSTRATYVYGVYIDEVLNMRRGGNEYYYHHDDMFNVMAVTDGNGNVAERYEYADYGKPELMDANDNPLAGNQSTIANPYLFSGREFDPETGWYYYRTRYLDPDSGRFTTRDTIGTWSDVNNLGNAFSYVGNSPWTRGDPNGTYQDPIFVNVWTPDEMQYQLEYLQTAQDEADNGVVHLENVKSNKRRCDSRFRKYFGKLDWNGASRFDAVKKTLTKVRTMIRHTPFTFINDKSCNPGTLAYIVPGVLDRVWFCDGPKGSITLLHEFTHIAGIHTHSTPWGGVFPGFVPVAQANSESECTGLAKCCPDSTEANPSSYARFAANWANKKGYIWFCVKKKDPPKSGSKHIAMPFMCVAIGVVYYLGRHCKRRRAQRW